MTRVIKTLIVGALLAPLAACGAPATGAGSGTLQVIAGENFWGSIAAQLGGSHVTMTSIVTNPNTDPHEYESSAIDARAFATADYVVLNGAGYDAWASKLLSANPNQNRKVFTVADLLNKKAGDNPHFWYNPEWVDTVADKITADYRALDSADAAYFTQQREALATALKPYHDAIAHIRATHTGVAVGSTESIFVNLAHALGLNLISPAEFMQAISEGTDPPAQTVAQFQDQISHRQIKVLVYNTQTSTPITDNLKQLATQNGIPVVGISETVQPATASFQDWQIRQLNSLQAALPRQ
ncbi:MAG TPA: zinc ABC transporter substrate-binding protein [Candidatus Dormibacteraeota bacterium]|nr:zinc ABC transporter substrate-binding protein [Candidatus Dormibacteraeota bacterium]